eukprot:3769596-Rhodomonas_salina.2
MKLCDDSSHDDNDSDNDVDDNQNVPVKTAMTAQVTEPSSLRIQGSGAFNAGERWEPPLKDVPGSEQWEPPLEDVPSSYQAQLDYDIYTYAHLHLQGGGGVGARCDAETRAMVSGVRGATA